MRSFRRVVVLLALCAGSGVAAAAVPLADFARHAQFRDIQISPQGDYVAATAVVDGKAVLSLIHLADMKGVNLRPRDGGEVVRFWWAAPHRVLYTVSERMSVLEQPGSTGEIYAVNADGSGKRLLIGYRANRDKIAAAVIEPLYAAGNKVLIETAHWNGSSDGVYPTAALMDVDSGVVVPRATAPIRNATFVADNRGQVRFAYTQGTDQKLRVYYREKDGASWELLFDESKHDPAVTPLGFDRDDGTVYFNCGGAHGFGGLCTWDVATRKLATLWSGSESGLMGLVRSFDRRGVVALRSMPGRTATTLIDKNAPEAKLLVGLMQEFPGEDVRITSSTPDGDKVVFVVSSDRDPGQFFLYDSSTRKAAPLFAERPWIKPEQMAEMEPIALKARDGLALHGYLTRPPGQEKANNLPLVVFVHGGPYGIRDEWLFDPYVQMLASRGYAVLEVNYRGSGGYGETFMHAGFGQWGGAMQDDVTDATHWAISSGIADPQRICIFGGSYGGYAALEGAVKEPQLYRCAIGYVGVYDLRLMYTRGDIPQSTYGDHYLKMVLGQDGSVLWDRSPIAHLDRLKAKVMLIVGGQDTRVPPVQGESMHMALNKAGIAHEWLYQRTEGHGFYDEKNAEDLFAKVIGFLDQNIGERAATHAAR